MKFANLRYLLASVAVLAAAVSCVDGDFDVPRRGAETGVERVNLYIPEATTRTVIDNDEGGFEAGQTLSLKWAEGDAFALWAANIASGAMTFANAVFTHSDNINDPQGVLFTGDIPRLMAQDTYYYYGFYPVPAEENIDETAVWYDIPTVQNGEYDPRCDIMRAEVSGRALSQSIENTLDLQFRHIMHVLKITIHSNPFGEKGVRKVRMEFPQPVAGRASVNIADGSFTLEEGRNVITAEFAEPKQAGDEFWVFVAPAATVEGEVKFTAFSGENSADEYMSDISATTAFKKFESQHITPVNLGLKGFHGLTWFDFEVDSAHLGEDVDVMHLSLPEGCAFYDGATAQDIYPDEDGAFRVAFRTDDLQEWGNVSVSHIYESQHAIFDDVNEPLMNIRDGEYTFDTHNVRHIEAPYIFFENFEGVTTDVSRDDNLTLSSTSAGYGSDTSYSFANAGLDGWSGARCGAYTDGYMRILNRSQYAGAVVFVAGNYHGRADSPSMSHLKPEAGARLQITFDYSMDRGRNNTSNFVQHYFAVGTHTVEGQINAGRDHGTTLENPVASDLFVADDFSTERNLTMTLVTAEECTSASRFAWEVYVLEDIPKPSGFIAGNYHNYWLYIDNVRVSIAK